MSHVCDTTLADSSLFGEIPYAYGYTFHTFGLFICIVAGGLAIISSAILMFLHTAFSNNYRQRKYILRILFMVPVYAAVSFLSYYFYLKAIYFQAVRDCYEAFAIANFYWLLMSYCGEDEQAQDEFLSGIKMSRHWSMMPCVPKPAYDKWLNIIHFGVFQYCFVRVTFTIVSCVTQYLGVYCSTSNSIHFAHVYVEAFEAVGVIIAMYCLIDLYLELRNKSKTTAPLSTDTPGNIHLGRPEDEESRPAFSDQPELRPGIVTPRLSSSDRYEYLQALTSESSPGQRDLTEKKQSGNSMFGRFRRAKDEPEVPKHDRIFYEFRVPSKVLSIKLVIFFSFWQNLVISMLLTYGYFVPSSKIGYNDYQVGWPAMLICVEMFMFSLLHYYSFSYRSQAPTEHPAPEERKKHPHQDRSRIPYAIWEAINPVDLLQAAEKCIVLLWRSIKWCGTGCGHGRNSKNSSQELKPRTSDYQRSPDGDPGPYEYPTGDYASDARFHGR